MITQGLSRRKVILATAGTMLALLLAALDQTIVGTAIPRIVADLNGLDRLAWVTTAYLVTSTTMTPIAGKLGDLFGRKPFLLAGMIGFVVASAFCGLSQNMTELIVFRGIQGIFGGVLFATVFTVIGDLFPPENRAGAGSSRSTSRSASSPWPLCWQVFPTFGRRLRGATSISGAR